MTYLRVFQGLEERCDPNQPNVVIPHHRLSLFVVRHLEGVLEDYS